MTQSTLGRWFLSSISPITCEKSKKLRHDGYTYVFSPYKLIWNGDYYYVVGYSEKHKGIGSFRIDRIVRQPTILDADANSLRDRSI